MLGDGESWSRQIVDLASLPEMARTFLQVAAGAADEGPMPMHRHGCPSRSRVCSGSRRLACRRRARATSGTTPDTIAARQELDLRPQLERLDRLIFWSERLHPSLAGKARPSAPA